eukprot:112417-Rhodomonas_salina.1
MGTTTGRYIVPGYRVPGNLRYPIFSFMPKQVGGECQIRQITHPVEWAFLELLFELVAVMRHIECYSLRDETHRFQASEGRPFRSTKRQNKELFTLIR